MAEILSEYLKSAEGKRLRIVVLDIAASKTGALSVLRDYYSSVQGLNDNNEWFFIIGVKGLIEEDAGHPDIHVILREDVKKSRIKRLLFDHFTGKGFLKELKPDVILSLQNTLPAGSEGIARTVIYLHQPLGFQKIKKFSFFNKWERELAVYQHLIAGEIDRSLKRADRIIVQTQWMKDAVIEKDGISADRIEILPPDMADVAKLCKPHSPEDDVDLCKPKSEDTGEALCKPRNGNGPDLCKPKLFIYPAGNILYKNHQCIIDAVRILYGRGVRDIKVIFTEQEKNLPWLTIPRECENCFEWRGMIEREELTGLYKKCVLLFPSYIETYGLPLAEARMMGSTVIAADTPFAREIMSGYGKVSYFNAFDPGTLAELMEKTYS